MKKSLVKAAVSAAASFAVLVSGTINSLAADTSYYTLTLLDFHGEVMTTIQVEAGSAPDLSAVDTDSLHEYVGVDTEKRFSSWSEVPQEMTADMTIQALYRQMTISADSEPSKKEYYDCYGDISLDGLKVTITVITQLPERNEDGSFSEESYTVDISSACTASPATLQEAFANSDNAVVNVYPPASDKPISSYSISYYPYLGDADMDGAVTASDATLILAKYSDYATGAAVTFEAGQKKRCDIDGNGKIDAGDA